jgi:hypothetical protein
MSFRHQVGVQIDAKIDLRAVEASELLRQRPKLVAVIDEAIEAGPGDDAADDRVANDDD